MIAARIELATIRLRICCSNRVSYACRHIQRDEEMRNAGFEPVWDRGGEAPSLAVGINLVSWVR